MVRKLLYLLFPFLLSLAPLSGLEPLKASLEPDPVGVRDNTTLEVDLPLTSTAGIEVMLPDLPEGVSVWRGPYIRTYQGPEYENRGYSRYVRISFTFRSETPGWKVLPALRFSAGGQEFETRPVLFGVGLYRGGILRIPFEPYWEIGKERVFAGETVPVVLRVPMQREVLLADDFSVEPPREGFFEPAERVGTIERTETGGYAFYNLPTAAYLLTPERAGNLTIPAAGLTINGLTERAAARTIEVLPLPQSVGETGAVGSFRYAADVSSDTLLEGEQFFIDVTVSGTGNLPYAVIPEPSAAGAELVSSSEEAGISSSRAGYVGSRVKRHEYVVSGEDDVRIGFPDFPFLDPSSGRVVIRTIGSLTVRVQGSDELVENGEEDPFPYEPRLLTARKVISRDAYLQARSYLWLLPGPLLFLVFFLPGRKKKRSVAALPMLMFFLLSSAVPSGGPSVISDLSARSAYDRGDDELALQEYRNLLEKEPGHPILLYNCAVTAYRAGRIGDAVFYGRSAYRSAPSDSRTTELVRSIEEREGFGFQAPLPIGVHPDLFFFLLMIGINLAGFVGVFYLLHRRNLTFIAAVLFLTLAVSSAIALGFSAADWARTVAVAGTDIPVQTIPDPEAGTLFRIREGEAVRVIGQAEEYLFVETGIDAGGWIPLRLVRIIGPRD
jgi:hypothetical protein